MNEFNIKLDGGEERMGELEDRSDKLFRMQHRDTQGGKYARDLQRLRTQTIKI